MTLLCLSIFQVVVPLYPQFSISTSGSSLRVLQDQFFKVTPPKKHIRSHRQVYQQPVLNCWMGRLKASWLASQITRTR